MKIDRQNCQPLAKVVMQFAREPTALVLLRADEPSAEFEALLVEGGVRHYRARALTAERLSSRKATSLILWVMIKSPHIRAV